jgi:hypothetical protein
MFHRENKSPATSFHKSANPLPLLGGECQHRYQRQIGEGLVQVDTCFLEGRGPLTTPSTPISIDRTSLVASDDEAQRTVGT